MSTISAYSTNGPNFTPAQGAPALSQFTPTPIAMQGSLASRTSTGFDRTPLPAISAATTSMVADQVGARFGAQLGADFGKAAGGGAISDALENGVARIAAFAHDGMKRVQQAIQNDMNTNGGQMDPAKMQQYTMQMSSYEMMTQMAAKIQEKQDAAIRAWLR